MDGLDFSELNCPIADIMFHIFRFDYDVDYTRGINKSVEKNYEQCCYLEARKTHVLKNKVSTKRKINKRSTF